MSSPLIDCALTGLADLLRSVTVQVQSDGRVAGAGVVWHRDGLIVSNAHVVRGGTVWIDPPGGGRLEARLLARDPQLDLAALFAPAPGLRAAVPRELPRLRVGEMVIALGHPFGISNALSLGVVHQVAAAGDDRPHWIRSTVRLAPGNSGGPLADAAGNVLGLNAMVAGGLAHSIPVSAVAEFLRRSGLHLTGERVA
jgi:serine protease Do